MNIGMPANQNLPATAAEVQIIFAIKQMETSVKVEEAWRKMGILLSL